MTNKNEIAELLKVSRTIISTYYGELRISHIMPDGSVEDASIRAELEGYKVLIERIDQALASLQTDHIPDAGQMIEEGCAECGKKSSEGWALYCVACMEAVQAEPVAVSYAIAGNGFVQKDERTSQLEIYELKSAAQANCPPGYTVKPVTVRRADSAPQPAKVPEVCVVVPRRDVESAINALRYGAHPERSPHADDLEKALTVAAGEGEK